MIEETSENTKEKENKIYFTVERKTKFSEHGSTTTHYGADVEPFLVINIDS